MERNESAAAIWIRGLRKRYGRDEALAGVDLAVPEGAVTLLVGPNGAGKTTLLRVLMDLLPYEKGEVEVLGMTPRVEGARIRAAAGFLPEQTGFPFGRLRVREILDLHARFRPGWDAGYLRVLVDVLGLRMETPWKKLSKGESRRVQLATALAHRPALLFLDEPTDGLDPVGREQILGLLAEHLAESAPTTLYCTHVLHEAQGIADHLTVLREGRVRVHAAVETLRRTHHRIRFAAGVESVASPSFLLREEGSAGGERVWVVRAREPEVREWAAAQGLPLLEVTSLSLADTALTHLSVTDGAPASGGSAYPAPEKANHG